MANRSWRRVQPIPGASGHASTGGCAAGYCTCACCCPAAAQRASAGATSGAGCATSGDPRRRSLDLVLNRPRRARSTQRREQRRLPGSGVSNCASWERPRLRARHQGVQGGPDQVAQRGKLESGEVCAAADDTGSSNMLMDVGGWTTGRTGGAGKSGDLHQVP